MTINDVAAFRAKSGTVPPLRRLLMCVAAVLISGVTLVAPAVVSSGATAVASAQADPCPAVQVVFARGTGEPDGTGRVGEAFVDALRPLVKGKSVAVYAVNYPATRDFLRAADGANDASSFVQNIANTCPDTRIVLGGYSQGAAVIDAITVADQPTLGFTQPMPADVANHVAAVAVFGNPSNASLATPCRRSVRSTATRRSTCATAATRVLRRQRRRCPTGWMSRAEWHARQRLSSLYDCPHPAPVAAPHIARRAPMHQ